MCTGSRPADSIGMVTAAGSLQIAAYNVQLIEYWSCTVHSRYPYDLSPWSDFTIARQGEKWEKLGNLDRESRAMRRAMQV